MLQQGDPRTEHRADVLASAPDAETTPDTETAAAAETTAAAETAPAAETPPAWHGLCVFVVPERSAPLLDETVKGIERGLEILAVVPLDERGRAAVAAHPPPGRPV